MPSADFTSPLVLIDTSVWIDYFLRKKFELERTVDALLEKMQAATTAIIMAELIQGSRGEKETKRLQKYFKPLHWIASNDTHWEMAGELSFKLRKSGKVVNLTDCYIASLAKNAPAAIFSLDKHFRWIEKAEGCVLFSTAAG